MHLQLLEKAFHSLPYQMAILDLDGKTVWSNHAISSKNEHLVKHINEMVQKQCALPILKDTETSTSNHDATLYPIQDHKNTITHALQISHNENDRLAIKSELELSEDKFHTSFNASAVSMIIADDQSNIFAANKSLCKLLGYEKRELLQMRFLDITHPEDIDRCKIRFKQCLEDLEPYTIEKRYVTKDGKTIDAILTCSPIFDNEGNLTHAIGHVQDVTEKKQIEKANQAYQSQLKRLSVQLAKVQEQERKSLSQRLHDGVSQKLAITKLSLQQYMKNVTTTQDLEQLDQINQMIHDIIEDSYSVMLEMSNPTLYELGLEPAIQSLITTSTLKEQGIQFTTEFPEDPLELQEHEAVILYQAIREILINAVKHSQATQCHIVLEQHHDHISININDNGIGFDTITKKNPDSYGGFGLLHLKENLESISGKLSINSSHNQGTSIHLFIPIDTQIN